MQPYVMVCFAANILRSFPLQAIYDLDADLEHHRLPMRDAGMRHMGDLVVTVRAVQALLDL